MLRVAGRDEGRLWKSRETLLVWSHPIGTVNDSFACNWSTSEECKNLDVVVLYQLLAANDDAVAYQIEEYSIIQIWLWFRIVWTVFNTITAWPFHYYMYCSGKITRQMPFVFLYFIMAINPAYKVWRRFQMGECFLTKTSIVVWRLFALVQNFKLQKKL